MADIDEETMPGAGFTFEDVTKVLTDAAAAMDPGSFIFMDDLTLHDAMGAFENLLIWQFRSSGATLSVPELYCERSPTSSAYYQNFLDLAKEQLMIIRSHPSPEPGSSSPAHHAFDPCIARRLKTFVPLRVIPVPPQEDTWKAVEATLNGWQEVSLLAHAHALSTWEIVGNLRLWLPKPPLRTPYLRSYTQSAFYDGLLILNKFTCNWMVDRFVSETLGVPYDIIVKTVIKYWPTIINPLQSMERILYKARRIIYLTKMLLELFALEERPFAYWYVAQVLEAHLCCLDELLNIVPKESTAYQELEFQHQLLTALQAISTAIFVACMSLLTFDWNRMRPAFFRRYKWAFRPEYDSIRTPPVAHPELYRIMPVCADVLQDALFSPSDNIEMARDILMNLIESGLSCGWAGIWATDRVQFLRNLVHVCETLGGLPKSVQDIEEFDVKTLKWDVTVHPWFPSVQASTSTDLIF
ncbi:hypothetical protein H0H81_010490 [Sphagnurus paluster]|uniref:Uncharacterized protein n=1 Tax=Sphagnurus paluster TaxID=117069 RepID=A0A9P7GP95_9AGAR|nr:hypothetical protein H0H81_010490 [Sphagnurus paluster]